MKLKFSIFLSICFASSALAQVPEDALRLTWVTPGGSARSQAIGGAMGSLGGDITATFVNPAGIGFYKTGEFVLSPGFSFQNNKSNFRGTNASDKSSAFNFGASGIVMGFGNRSGQWKSSAFSVAINRTANFNSRVFYKGENTSSSFSEQFAEEFANSGLRIGDPMNENTPLSIGTRMAVYTYLIDTATINGTKRVIGLPELLANRNQENTIETTGGITELSLGLAGNMNDKFYLGGAIGLPIVNLVRTTMFRESDATGNLNNGFNYFSLSETNTTKGIGVNVKLGLIFKPVEYVRLGLAVHSPTLYGLRDSYNGQMTTVAENQNPNNITVASSLVNGDYPVEYNYDLVSPWKVMASGSYVFREIEDVTKQKGFITADLEYINYGNSSYRTAEDNADNSYYTDVNSTIKDIYKSSLNFRLGGELKFNTIMARAGFSYYGNPYTDSELKARRMFISGGLGYRNKGYFFDLTYVHGLQNDVNFPYRLTDKPNTFADIKGSGGNILATLGFKF